MIIQHNIMAKSSYRNYNGNARRLSKNLEKLSSGYRINRAGDDAAGLAISEKMRAQITGLNAAQKNVQDGISLVQTAEGALQEVQDMLGRMVYLATQSANGTYDDEVDRANLQKEVGALSTEIDRIADSSNFNGINLLDGSLDSDGRFSVGMVAGTVGIEGYNGSTGDLLLPRVGTVQGVNTVLHDTTSVDKTAFSVDLGTVGFDNGAGNQFELNVGSMKFTINGGATTGGTKAVYETSVLAAPLEGEKTYRLGICGKNYDVKGETAQEQATQWVTQYQADANNSLYNAVYDSGSGKVRFTQVYAGTGSGHPGTTVVVAGRATTPSSGTITLAAPAANGDIIRIDNQSYMSDGVGGWSYAGGGTAKYQLITDMNTGVDLTIKGLEGNNGTFTIATSGSVSVNSSSVTLTGGLEEVFGIYESSVVTRSTNVVSEAPVSMTYDGHSIDVSTYDTVQEQLEAFAASYNAAGKQYTAALGDGGNTLVFTARNEGAIGGDGPSAAPGGTGITQKVAGSDGATSPPMDSEDLAAMIAGLGGSVTLTGATDNGDGTVTINGTTYEVSAAGSRITFTQTQAGAGNDNASKTVSVNVGDAGVTGTYDTQTTVTSQSGDITDVRLASTLVELTDQIVRDGAFLSIAGETLQFTSDVEKAAADGYIDISSGDLTEIAKSISDAMGGNDAFDIAAVDGSLLLVEKNGQRALDLTEAEGFLGAIRFGSETLLDGEGLTLQIGDTGEIFNRLTVNIEDMHAQALGIGDVDVSTQQGAQNAIEVIRAAVNSVSMTRGTLGATQNRLEHTANNLSVMEENIQDAESGIRDTDMAEEMMAYTKNNILLQSAQAMLAQANTVPQGVLQLLG